MYRTWKTGSSSAEDDYLLVKTIHEVQYGMHILESHVHKVINQIIWKQPHCRTWSSVSGFSTICNLFTPYWPGMDAKKLFSWHNLICSDDTFVAHCRNPEFLGASLNAQNHHFYHHGSDHCRETWRPTMEIGQTVLHCLLACLHCQLRSQYGLRLMAWNILVQTNCVVIHHDTIRHLWCLWCSHSA